MNCPVQRLGRCDNESQGGSVSTNLAVPTKKEDSGNRVRSGIAASAPKQDQSDAPETMQDRVQGIIGVIVVAVIFGLSLYFIYRYLL